MYILLNELSTDMLLFYSAGLFFWDTLGGRLDVEISTSSTCECTTILCKYQARIFKMQVKPYSFNFWTTLSYYVAIIKIKRSGCC